MLATQIYRDNFVYKINTPLCDAHAKAASKHLGHYAYIEKYNEVSECRHCESERRDKALEANSIHWFFHVDDKQIYEHKDRKTFWTFVKKYLNENGGCNSVNWQVKEIF